LASKGRASKEKRKAEGGPKAKGNSLPQTESRIPLCGCDQMSTRRLTRKKPKRMLAEERTREDESHRLAKKGAWAKRG